MFSQIEAHSTLTFYFSHSGKVLSVPSLHQVLDNLNSNHTIKVVRELSAKQSVSVHLVGEALSNLLLGTNPRPYHFVVAGDATNFATSLAEQALGHLTEKVAGEITISRYFGELGELYFIPSGGLNIGEYMERKSSFTIDSLAFDLLSDEFLAFHNALADIQAGLIRLVSPISSSRHGPDNLLRAVSLALSHPALTIERQTFLDIKANNSRLAKADPAYVGHELSRILGSQEYCRGIELLNELGLLTEIFNSFLPGVGSNGEECGEVERLSYPVEVFMMVSKTVDDLIPPTDDFLKRNAYLLREVTLLSQQSKHCFLHMSPAEIKPFLRLKGEQIERQLGRLVGSVAHVFRVRMVTVGYLNGIVALTRQSSGVKELQRVLEQTIGDFGAFKGLLSSVLICADWITSRGGGVADLGDMQAAREILGGMTDRLARRRAAATDAGYLPSTEAAAHTA